MEPETCANDEELATDFTTLLTPVPADAKGKRKDDRSKIKKTSSRKWSKIPSFKRSRASKKTRIIALFALFVVCAVVGITLGIILPRLQKKDEVIFQSELGNFSKAAVATDAAQCAEVGKIILEKNGSAVDSAIATLLCMGVVLPQSMGIGGGFLMTIYHKENDSAAVLDAREVAPEFATEDMFENQKDASLYGGLSIAVPGEIHGMYLAHQKYGKLDWRDLFAPAINLSRYGFEVGEHLARAAQEVKSQIKDDNAGMLDLLINNETKEFYKAGEIMINTKLADTLEQIAINGSSKIYYHGDIAKKLVQDIKDAGGNITAQDFANYTSRWLDPVEVKLDNLTLYSVPPPGSGVLLAFMLNILDGYNYSTPLKSEKEKVLFYHRAIEAFKFAYAKRMEFEDSDSNEIKELVKLLKNDSYADEVRRKISDKTTFDPSHYGVKGLAKMDHGTAHMSVLAPNGDAVSVTSTINLYYGSLVRSMSTGILLNNEMDDFSTNETNSFGVPPTTANRIRPGKRPMSSMAPAIFVDNDGNVRMAIGGNGGTHITSAITLVTALNLWMDMNIKEAIDEPRVHDQLFPQRTTFEKRFSKNMVSELRKMNHTMTDLTGRGAVIIGIARGKDERIYANSDYRKGGKVAGF